MIDTRSVATRLLPSERYALDLLIDLSRLVPVDRSVGAVQLEVTDQTDGGSDAIASHAARGWSIQRRDGAVTVSRAALRRICDVAATASEWKTSERDRFGRVPPSENELVAERLEREPVVSLAAAELRSAVIAAAERRPIRLAAPWPQGKRWAAAFTHDLDVVALWPFFTGLRVVELVRKRELSIAARVVGAAVASVAADPVQAAISDILDRERELAIRSTWFVLCGTPTLGTMRRGDLTYKPESPAARKILSEISAAAAEVGLHGSFETRDGADRFSAQRTRLEQLAGKPVVGVRQHFLRTEPDRTPQAMASAGFTYDSSSGFPDRNGFRAGVADALPLWDVRAGAPLGIEEVPFCWMDRALSKYRGVEDPGAWTLDALELADRCRAVEGLWVGVWHPNLTPALGFPGAPDAFGELARAIVLNEPFTATLEDLVTWRRARRGIRARGVQADGSVDAYSPATAPWPLTLEEPSGRPAEAVRTGER